MKILFILLSIDWSCWLPMLFWLLGAFLLGWLLRHLFGSQSNGENNQDNDALQFQFDNYKRDSENKYNSLLAKFEGNKEDSAKLATALSQIDALTTQLQSESNKAQAANVVGTSSDTMSEKYYKAISAFFGTKIVRDDLKLVEGIGPKIEEIFHRAGLTTWLSVAESTPEQLRAILNAEGDSYKIHDPGTWPQQCRMMVDDEWAKLKAWQDELDGGKIH